MKPNWQIITGDALAVLQGMDSESVDCLMTSPPYWALRDYGVDGQLGLEEHPQLYLDKLWAIFDEAKRVLKPTGTCWVNMGDTFGGSHCGANDYRGDGASISASSDKYQGQGAAAANDGSEWLKPKNLLMMPERFAIGMVENGWWLRNKIVWSKPNPMPSSVKDRFSCTWEYIFMFSKAARYYFDLDAVREATGHETDAESYQPQGEWREDLDRAGKGHTKAGPSLTHPLGKNPGDCWSIPTHPFPDAHFAVYPPDLIVKPIRAGCPPKVCVECGKPWERIVERNELSARDDTGRTHSLPEQRMGKSPPPERGWQVERKTLGWQPTCECGADTEPGTVLDPFAGAHTTGLVAIQEGRRYIGVDISEEYNEMGRRRLSQAQAPLLT